MGDKPEPSPSEIQESGFLRFIFRNVDIQS
jgi:hypothetical protein